MITNLIETAKNFTFKDVTFVERLFEISLSEDNISQRCAFTILDVLFTKVSFNVQNEDSKSYSKP